MIQKIANHDKPWFFNDPEKRKKVLDKIVSKQALLVTGSPMCKAYSRLQDGASKGCDLTKWKGSRLRAGDTLNSAC